MQLWVTPSTIWLVSNILSSVVLKAWRNWDFAVSLGRLFHTLINLTVKKFYPDIQHKFSLFNFFPLLLDLPLCIIPQDLILDLHTLQIFVDCVLPPYLVLLIFDSLNGLVYMVP